MTFGLFNTLGPLQDFIQDCCGSEGHMAAIFHPNLGTTFYIFNSKLSMCYSSLINVILYVYKSLKNTSGLTLPEYNLNYNVFKQEICILSVLIVNLYKC